MRSNRVTAIETNTLDVDVDIDPTFQSGKFGPTASTSTEGR